MEENQNNKQLEAKLGSHRRKAAFAKIVTYGAGAMMVLFLMTGMIPIMIVFLVIVLVGGYQMSKHTKELKKILSDNIVSSVLNEVFDGVEYNPFGHIPDRLISAAGMDFSFDYDRVYGSDYVKGTYKGLQVELSDVELCQIQPEYDEDMQKTGESEQKVFAGQWLVCDFGKELSGEVHVSENTRSQRRRHKKDRIEMENEGFNERFIVTARNPQEAYYILTPHMMEYILSAAGKSGGVVYMAFLRDGKLHIAVQTGHDFFELGKSESNVELLRQKFLDELQWFTDIIDELRVEENIYKKEMDYLPD